MAYEDLGDEDENMHDEWKKRDQEEEQSDIDSDDSNVEVKRMKKMEGEISTYFKQQKEYSMDRDRKTDRKETKKKTLIDQQRLKMADQSEEEELNNEELRETKVKFSKATKLNDVSSSDEEDDGKGGIFLNPLLAKKP